MIPVHASPPTDPVEAALVWIVEYIQNSRLFPQQYLKPDFVIKTLRPLLRVSPFVPPSKPLYLITDLRVKDGKRVLSPDRVISFTTMKDKSSLSGLAMDLGYEDGYVLWKAPPVFALVSPEWLKALVRPLSSSEVFLRNPRLRKEFIDIAKAGTAGQEEVIGFVSRPTPLKDRVFVVKDL